MMPRTGELTQFAEAIERTGLVQVNLSELWNLWAATVPRLVGDPAQVASLAAALTELANQAMIELPIGAWDTSTTPPLPRSIRVPAARKPVRDRGWIRYPWRAELGWVASLASLSDNRFHDLIAVNSWLGRTDGGKVPVVPVRYRSAEVFEDEKCLDQLARTNLFGPGRLSFELLSCVRIPAPLPAVLVGPGADVLIVENSDTYWVATQTLKELRGHNLRAVAWGSGKAFPSQVGALGVDVAGAGPIKGIAWYWGDLDPAGVAIAVDAASAGISVNAPAIRPALGLWASMAQCPVQDRGTVNWYKTEAQQWFGTALWDKLAPIRHAAGRVAQESVPASAIVNWARTIQA